MKCPTCGYIGFEATDRCRNCGYDFALSATPAPVSGRELPLRADDTEGALREIDLTMEGAASARTPDRAADLDRVMRNLDRVLGEAPAPDLPLFDDDAEADLPPLVSATAAPRRPLAVRRATPDPSRLRTKPVRHTRATPQEQEQEQELELPLPDTPRRQAPAPRESVAPPDAEWPGAPPLRRALAAAVDVGLLAAIDVVVVYFTLKMCGLTTAEFALLPPVPLGAFFLLVNGGYLAAFTAAGGQTIGKMAMGLKVVGHADLPVSAGLAVVRAAGCLVSLASFGLGFAPALLGDGGRAIEDRMADTRVVRMPAA